MNETNYYFVRPYDNSLSLPPQEKFGQILNEAYLHPFDWEKRTTRKSYWISLLINVLIAITNYLLIVNILDNININLGLKWIAGVISLVIFIWLFLAQLGQCIRRLHDVNYSGYWYWLSLIGPGSLFILYLLFQPSIQKPVKWGTYLFLDHAINVNTYYTQIYNVKNKHDDTPIPTIGQIIKEHFFNCFTWNARSTRTSYWLGTAITYIFTLISLLVFALLSFSAFSIFNIINLDQQFSAILTFILFNLFSIMGFWIIIAQISHTIRRLHDANFSGWWLWISLIPYIGEILIMFLLFHPTFTGKTNWNKYLFSPTDRIR